LSPLLHRAAYEALGLTEWSYDAVETTEDTLEQTLRSLAAAGLAGVSLTMPLKKTVMPLLTELDDAAATVGAANTVIFEEAGWRGANTDVPGFVAVLRDSGVSLAGDPPWVVGAGATAGAALAALGSAGARSAVIVARRPAAAEELRPLGERVGVSIEIRPWSELPLVTGVSLVVATTPAGATDPLAEALQTAPPPAPTAIWLDVVYAPWPTRAAAAWRAAGGRVVGGIELLIEQAAEQVRLMTGSAPPVAEMRSAGRRAVGADGADAN
jgi:shikimate dehydrogenase